MVNNSQGYNLNDSRFVSVGTCCNNGCCKHRASLGSGSPSGGARGSLPVGNEDKLLQWFQRGIVAYATAGLILLLIAWVVR